MMGTRSMGRGLLAAGAALAAVLGTLGLGSGPAAAAEHEGEAKMISCTMEFSEEAWAVFLVGKGHGEGHITCDNGQEADALIKSESVGVETGKMDVQHGEAVFGDLSDIDEAFGRYASSSAAAAAGETAAAGGLLKIGGKVKLGFHATGEGGGGLGRTWGIVTIERKK